MGLALFQDAVNLGAGEGRQSAARRRSRNGKLAAPMSDRRRGRLLALPQPLLHVPGYEVLQRHAVERGLASASRKSPSGSSMIILVSTSTKQKSAENQIPSRRFPNFCSSYTYARKAGTQTSGRCCSVPGHRRWQVVKIVMHRLK